ncbi:MAG TPA: ribosome recycling factor [Candidatus Dormibacteraeota bacterium]|nr:ribosome recycling factor [Candidatus Dormibacteraeota bacterium]
MNPNQIIDQSVAKFKQVTDHFEEELKKQRTGRAHPSMLDGLMAEAYGAPMPLNQLATISAPDSQSLQISPFDPNNLQAIVNAIRNNPSLGLNPTDDGRLIRVPIPPLNEERRREIVKVVSQKQEECNVSLRNVRHETKDSLNASKKNKQIGEDDFKRLEKLIDDALNKARAVAERAAGAKEQELMTV